MSAVRPERPVVVQVVESAGRELVARCCRSAQAAGVRAGMTLAHARALWPATIAQAPAAASDGPGPGRPPLLVEPFDSVRDLAALATLAHWALRFTPLAAPDPFPLAEGLILDITGCQRLFRGEPRLMHLIADGIGQLGFAVRVACAPTLGAAWAVARFGPRPRMILGADDLPAALAALPVRALRLDAATDAALAEVGITRIRHVMDLPRSQVPSRFGDELLLRLDQALGRAAEGFAPVRPVDPPRVERIFAGPTTQLQALQVTMQDLLAGLSRQLLERESGARRIDVVMARVDAPPLGWSLTLARPSREPRHLWALLRPRLENAPLDFGIESVAITVPLAGRLPHQQAGSWAGAAAADADLGRAFAELVDLMTSRLGTEQVVQLEPVATHVPERAFRPRPGRTPPRPARPTPRRRGARAAMDRAQAQPDAGLAAPAPSARPSLLLPESEPIQAIALLPEGPPTWIRWRGQGAAIAASLGPERIAGEWWRSSPDAPRDYFKVQDARGRWLWIYRELATGRWFLHGLWA